MPDPSAASSARAPAARRPGDLDALILAHRRMARGIAAEYRGDRMGWDDLAATADLALVQAARKFDPARDPGCFRSYAAKVIRSHLREALAMSPMVRLSRDTERAALRGGDAAPGWSAYAVAVEDLGLAELPPTGPMADIDAALAERSSLERDLIDLVFVERLTTGQAARRLGITPRAARDAYNGALLALARSFRAMGYQGAGVPDLAARN